MKLSAVFAGCCIVLVLCSANTQGADQCPQNLVFVFDCLSNSNADQWKAVKEFVKHVMQHLPGTADVSKVRMGLVAVDGEKDGVPIVIQLKADAATMKRTMMAYVDAIRTDRPPIHLVDSANDLANSGVFADSDKSLRNGVVIFKDSSVPGGITSQKDDKLHEYFSELSGNPMNVHFYRINDAVEDSNFNEFMKWFNANTRSMIDYKVPDSSSSLISSAAAYKFVKAILQCDAFGNADDPLEASATGVTLPPPPPTQQPQAAGSTTTDRNSALSLTKTSLHAAVVGLLASVLTTVAAMSTFWL